MPELGCTPNAITAFSFLINKGLRDYQAAAVVGNLQQESFPRLDTRLRAFEKKKNNYSQGIAMWQPPRWAALIEFAAGRDPYALDTQLDFLWHELETEPGLGLEALRTSTSLQEAVVIFQNKFENPDPASAATDKRIVNADAILRHCELVNPPPEPPPKKTGAIVAAIGASVLFVAATIGAYKLFGRPRPEPLPRYEPVLRPRPIPPPAFRRVP